MRFSLNTITLALISSSVIFTDVIAAPLNRAASFGKPKRSLQVRQDSVNQTEILQDAGRIYAAVRRIARLDEDIAEALQDLIYSLGLDDSDYGASYSGTYGSQDSGYGGDNYPGQYGGYGGDNGYSSEDSGYGDDYGYPNEDSGYGDDDTYSGQYPGYRDAGGYADATGSNDDADGSNDGTAGDIAKRKVSGISARLCPIFFPNKPCPTAP